MPILPLSLSPPDGPRHAEPSRPRRPWVLLAVLVAVAVGLVWLWRRRAPEPAAPPAEGAASGVAPPVAAPLSVSPAEAPAAPAMAPPTPAVWTVPHARSLADDQSAPATDAAPGTDAAPVSPPAGPGAPPSPLLAMLAARAGRAEEGAAPVAVLPPSLPTPVTEPAPPPRPWTTRLPDAWPVAAIVAALTGQWLLISQAEALGLLCYALAVLVAARGPASPPGSAGPAASSQRERWLWLGGVLAVTLLAAAIRLYRLDEIPPGLWADETDLARVALTVRDGHRPVPWESLPHLEVSYLMIYGLALFMVVLGPTFLAVKLPAVLAGALAAPALYLLARRFLSPGLALTLAGLWAVVQWSVNVSRWGHVNSWTPVFACLCLWLVWRGLAEGRRRDWLLAGLIYGGSIHTYSANRATLVIVGLFVAHWLLVVDRGAWRRHLAGLGLFGLGAGVLALPLLLTYLRDPALYLGRTMAVSILDRRFTADPGRTLLENIGAYLQVFHYRGDPNPRHSIPLRPMLDLPLAALATVGLARALRLFRQPGPFLTLAWLGIYFGAGIMTTEAPNTFRVYGILPAILLLVGLALAPVAAALPALLAPLTLPWDGSRRLVGPALALLLVGGVAVIDLNTYFNVAAQQPATWGAFNASHTRAGLAIGRLQGPWTVYLDRDLHGWSQVDVISADRPKEPMRLTSQLVPPAGATAPVFWVFSAYLTPALDYLRLLYPDGESRVERSPTGELLFSSFTLPTGPPPDGLLRERWVGESTGGPPAESGAAGPLRPEPAAAGTGVATVHWRGVLRLPEATPVTWRLTSTNATRLYLNGDLILDTPGDGVAVSTRLWLPGGSLPLRLERVIRRPDDLRLDWQPDGQTALAPLPTDATAAVAMPDGGLVAVYFEGSRLGGPPFAIRQDPLLLSNNFGNLATYAQRWVGDLVVPSDGDYDLIVVADDAARLWLDGEIMVDDWSLHGARSKQATRRLTAGRHPIVIDYLDYGGSHQFALRWRPPGGVEESIPLTALRWRSEQVAAAAMPPPSPATVFLPVVDGAGRPTGQLPAAETRPRPGQPRPPQQDANHLGFLLKVGERIIERGIGVFVPTTLVFRLDGAYSRVQGSVGIDRDSYGDQSARFQIVADDRVLFDSGPRSAADPPLAFDLDLTGVQRLVLIADDEPAQRENAANWLEIRLVRP